MKKSIALLLLFIFAFSIIAIAASDNPKDKVVYITFDDGPTPNTPKILEILRSHGAKATFFVLEDRIRQYPDYIRLIYAEGHSIGLHGTSHDVNTVYSTPSEPLHEMNVANQTLSDICGFTTTLVRTPYGSYPYMSHEQYKILLASDYRLWDWTIDPRDGVGTPDISTVLSNIKNDLKGNENPIVLLHDRKSTANYLNEILNYFSREGYRFEVIDEKMDPVNFMELYGPAGKK